MQYRRASQPLRDEGFQDIWVEVISSACSPSLLKVASCLRQYFRPCRVKKVDPPLAYGELVGLTVGFDSIYCDLVRLIRSQSRHMAT